MLFMSYPPVAYLQYEKKQMKAFQKHNSGPINILSLLYQSAFGHWLNTVITISKLLCNLKKKSVPQFMLNDFLTVPMWVIINMYLQLIYLSHVYSYVHRWEFILALLHLPASNKV